MIVHRQFGGTVCRDVSARRRLGGSAQRAAFHHRLSIKLEHSPIRSYERPHAHTPIRRYVLPSPTEKTFSQITGNGCVPFFVSQSLQDGAVNRPSSLPKPNQILGT